MLPLLLYDMIYDVPLTKINRDVEVQSGDAIRGVIKSCREEYEVA